MLCKRLRSLSEVSSSWGYVSCFCCQRGARGLPSRAQAWKPDVTFRLESLSRAHRAQSGVYIQPTVSSSSSFALLYFPSDFRCKFILYFSQQLGVFASVCLPLWLHTFEKEGLSSYLGHCIKVAAASVGGISSQPERDVKTEERRSSNVTVH